MFLPAGSVDMRMALILFISEGSISDLPTITAEILDISLFGTFVLLTNMPLILLSVTSVPCEGSPLSKSAMLYWIYSSYGNSDLHKCSFYRESRNRYTG